MYVCGTLGGGIRIKDATANPGDVAEGMIFYNNTGRQVGTGEMVKKILMPKQSGSFTEYSGVKEGYRYSSTDGYTFSAFQHFANNYIKGYYNVISGIRHIIGIEIDGRYSLCPSMLSGYTSYVYYESGYDRPWFYHYYNSVYLVNNNNIPSSVKDRQIIIHYTDK